MTTKTKQRGLSNVDTTFKLSWSNLGSVLARLVFRLYKSKLLNLLGKGFWSSPKFSCFRCVEVGYFWLYDIHELEHGISLNGSLDSVGVWAMADQKGCPKG